MPFVCAHFADSIPLQTIMNVLLSAFPRSFEKDEDLFATRLSAVRSMIAKAESENRETEGYQHVQSSIEQALSKNGLTKLIVVQVGNQSIQGSICSLGLLFAAKNDQGIDAINQIAAIVNSAVNCTELEVG